MPKLGEIRNPKELGYRSKTKRIWAACENCGKERWVAVHSGKPISKRCRQCYIGRYGEKNPAWNGGRFTTMGYIKIYVHPDDFFHPMAGKDNYVMEHRLIMAKHLGRCLLPWEVIHHKNGIRSDNRLGNLLLLPTNTHHLPDLRLKAIVKQLRQQVINERQKGRKEVMDWIEKYNTGVYFFEVDRTEWESQLKRWNLNGE